MRIAITGAAGQLGRALQAALGARHETRPLTRAEMDLTDLAATRAAIGDARPDVVIHAGAYTNVDQCETERELAFRVNALGTRNVAVAAAETGARLVAVSTNYVFDGAAAEPYHEWAEARPVSVYGASKLAGEQFARELAGGRFYIIRTGWLYDELSRNFVTTMLGLAEQRSALKVVGDQHGQPTYVADLAAAIGQLIEAPAYGVYHLTNAGACSRHAWVVEMMRLAGREDIVVEAVPGATMPRPARAPGNGVLHNWAGAAIGVTLRPWQAALADCLARRAALQRSAR